MTTRESYSDAIKFLYDLQLFGTALGLERATKLAKLAGDPQRHLRFIHVAGTNGKGSTCAMLESIYRHAGLRVGLFTSPHLVAFGERIQVNREMISEADIVRLVGEMKALLGQFGAEEHPTFFEVVTVMALKYFAEQKCDLVIWETGLGGRLDATNIVTPLVSVITNIQFDHQAWLGDTLAKIAAEKAGIIKARVPVVTAVDEREAFRVLFEVARQNEAPFWLITWTQSEFPPLRGLELPLLGEHQRLNAAVATYAVRAVGNRIAVSDDDIRAGLLAVRWPGRLQLIERAGGKKFLLDGAHNIGGAESLRMALQTYFATQSPTLVLGMLRDKDCREVCNILVPLAKRILLAPVRSQRTAAANELAKMCREANASAEVIETNSLAEALTLAEPDEFVVIAGSLYLIGEAMEMFKLGPSKSSDERGLNEWGTRGN
ncbi:MAG TPA: folylpolyglutamate synthase/dihydrofolate synthase family protein [Verrucomicrobiae bacterium]|jgi:dihydrofolate synthase/folylpolyglutamate synthase|nr:folylpolyglutamate synthase/dihydrofolate synthase family protein [Verrucomicrobiae bacterium]